MTAPVWIRGILQDEYGVKVESCEYYTGGRKSPDATRSSSSTCRPSIRVRHIGPRANALADARGR